VVQLCKLFQLVNLTHRVTCCNEFLGVCFVLHSIEYVDYIVDHVGHLTGQQERVEWFIGVGDKEIPFILKFVVNLYSNDVNSQFLHDLSHKVFII